MLFCLVTFAPCHIEEPDDAVVGSIPDAREALLIVELYPRGLCEDEYLGLFNAAAGPCNLRNWSITDGEGTILLVRDNWIPSGSRATISFNSSSYLAAYGVLPTVCLDDGNTSGAVLSGTFRLGDQGDSVSLLGPGGILVDAACYGTSAELPGQWSGVPIPGPKQGEVLRRVRTDSGYVDTDSWLDWTPFREFRYGYTELSVLETELEPGQLTAFTSPDSSLSVLTECIENTQRSILMCAYEASSEMICHSLLGALRRGVTIRLLVDGSPAGGLSEGEMVLLSVLTNHGADVRLLSGNLSEDIVQHVGDLHAKYAVFDGSESVILSENFVDAAFPSDQLRGNRGWGVLVSDHGLAGCLETIFEADSRITRPGVRSWALDSRYDPSAVLDPAQVPADCQRVIEPLRSTSSARVRVYASPDCSESEPFLCELLVGSNSLLCEQFQTDLNWSTRWSDAPCTSPLVASVASAARNGAQTSMLLDSSWFNMERNTATCDYLRSETVAAGGAAEFRMMDLGGPVKLLHNKGLVIDERLTVISSNNWVFASFARNRELALVIDSQEVASFFSRAFYVDWLEDESPPVADAGKDIVVHLGERVTLDGSPSRDDRAISSWSWDVYSDGEPDGSDPVLEFYAVRPGVHKAVLTVEDPWGNRDTDSVEFTVLPADSDRPAPLLERHLGLLAVGLGVSGCFVGAMLARKVNHRRLG